MKYVGGKSKIAKHIVPLMKVDGCDVWEPFCGGGAVSVELAKRARRLVCSDACLPLIVMYAWLHAGWVPPAEVSEAEYAAAKALPDTDPRKAFIGFGCSFGSKWFGGYARGGPRNYAAETVRNLTKAFSVLRPIATFASLNFFDVPVRPATGLVIYCDPPYEGTQGYGAVGTFDHRLFWTRCWLWAQAGARVFVSEYNAPAFAKLLWSKSHAMSLSGGAHKDARLEKFFEIA